MILKCWIFETVGPGAVALLAWAILGGKEKARSKATKGKTLIWEVTE